MSSRGDSPVLSGVAISLVSVSKSYGAKTAVDGLTLQVRAGEVFAFLGPNGAGKTTTIKMIVGLLHADEGRIDVCGHAMGVNGLAAKSRISYVPDQPFVYDKLTGREFLGFVREMYAVPKDTAQQRIAEFTQRLGMELFLDRLCEGYSHGMKQKVVLAAALLHDPDVLVVDEPMVGLDPRTVRIVKDLFVERARRGKSVFMSTHTLEVAEAIADRIGIINKGHLITVGTFDQLKTAAERQHSLEEIFLKLTEDEDLERIEGVP